MARSEAGCCAGLRRAAGSMVRGAANRCIPSFESLGLHAPAALTEKTGDILTVCGGQPTTLRDIVESRLQQAALTAPGVLADTATPGLAGWADCDASRFSLRTGPDYRRNQLKAPSGPALYTCCGADLVCGRQKIECALASVGCVRRLDDGSGAPAASSLPAAWRDLPDVLVFNFQLPFEAGPILGPHPREDGGCSILLYFRVSEYARRLLAAPEQAPPAFRSLIKYFAEDGHPLAEGNQVTRCIKVCGMIENLGDLEIPPVLRPFMAKFNGKPVLCEKESMRYAAPDGRSAVEVAVDVRGFNPAARVLLRRLRGQLSRCTVQLGLLLQACADEDMPEQLIGAVNLRGMDLLGGRRLDMGGEEGGNPVRTQSRGGRTEFLGPPAAPRPWWAWPSEQLRQVQMCSRRSRHRHAAPCSDPSEWFTPPAA